MPVEFEVKTPGSELTMGTAGAVTDLLGGRIDYMFLPVHVALQHIQAAPDVLDGRERPEVERAGFAGAPVVGITAARGARDGDAVRAAREALDLAQHLAVMTVNHGDTITVRHEDAMRRRIEHNIVPAIRRAAPSPASTT